MRYEEPLSHATRVTAPLQGEPLVGAVNEKLPPQWRYRAAQGSNEQHQPGANCQRVLPAKRSITAAVWTAAVDSPLAIIVIMCYHLK